MAGKSLPPVSAKVIADVEKYIADMRRAERATAGAGLNIDKEVDKISKSVKKKFSAGDIGKELLRGIGIGSGFQVAQTAVELFADYWRQAAESATTVAREAERATKALLSGLEKRRTAPQNIAALEQEQARLQRELEGARQARTNTEFTTANAFRGARFGALINPLTVGRNISGNFTANLRATEEAERIKADLQEIANTIADAKARLKKETEDKAAADLKLLQKESADMVDNLRKEIFGGREEAALRALDHKNELLLKGTRPGEPLNDSLSRQGLFLNTPSAGQVDGEQKKQTSLLAQLLTAVRSLKPANPAAVGTVIY